MTGDQQPDVETACVELGEALLRLGIEVVSGPAPDMLDNVKVRFTPASAMDLAQRLDMT